MGQKIHPQSYRLGIIKDWSSRWFFVAKGSGSQGLKNYSKFLQEDEAIRKTIRSKISLSGIAGIEIERTSAALRIVVKAARPGFIIGRGGKGIEELSKALEKAITKVRGHKPESLSVNIEELKRTEVSAAYVAQQIAWDLEKRMPFRQTMKKYLEATMQNREVKGAKVFLSGRLDGGEIARREWKAQGSLPLQTMRADIDYAQATAYASYGTVGIKVWIYKGEVFDKKNETEHGT
jgi:small subunit ribosomal protein S3